MDEDLLDLIQSVVLLVIGSGLTVVGGLVTASLRAKSDRKNDLKDRQLEVCTAVLVFTQEAHSVVRKYQEVRPSIFSPSEIPEAKALEEEEVANLRAKIAIMTERSPEVVARSRLLLPDRLNDQILKLIDAAFEHDDKNYRREHNATITSMREELK